MRKRPTQNQLPDKDKGKSVLKRTFKTPGGNKQAKPMQNLASGMQMKIACGNQEMN